MDRFKDFLQQHKDELDDSHPDQQTWDHIIAHIKPAAPKYKYRAILAWSAAAAVLLLVGISVVLMNRPQPVIIAETSVHQDTVVPQALQPPPPPVAVMVNKPPVTPAPAAPPKQPMQKGRLDDARALSTLDASYNEIFKARLTSLSNTPLYPGSETCIADFKKQLQQINKDQQILEGRIRQEGLNDDMLQHLIVIYQQKLTLLEQLQTIIKKMNNLGPSTDSINTAGSREISSLIRMI